MNTIDLSYPEGDERRRSPAERMLEDTWTSGTNINFAIVRRKSFGRGYWFGYASATLCALIWVVLDLWTTGRLSWLGG